MTEVPVRPRLLVSVRNAAEAQSAVAGGCDLLDMKEPSRGSLGMADLSTINAIVNGFADSLPVTAALGECRDWTQDALKLPTELSFVKLGLSGMSCLPDWPRQWQAVREQFDDAADHPFRWIAVAYADWHSADSPPPAEIVDAAIATECAGVLFDTFTKSDRNLFDWLSFETLHALTLKAQSAGLIVAWAGSIGETELLSITKSQADIVAVRTAACRYGNRNGPICANTVRRLRDALYDRAKCKPA